MHVVDALAITGDEGRVKSAKSCGELTIRALIRRCPNGETHLFEVLTITEYHKGCGGEPGELKHLSSPEEQKSTEIPQVAASERGSACTTIYHW